MNNERALLVLDFVKAMAMLLIVCGAILLSIEVLFSMNIFSFKNVIALAVLVESVNALRSVV